MPLGVLQSASDVCCVILFVVLVRTSFATSFLQAHFVRKKVAKWVERCATNAKRLRRRLAKKIVYPTSSLCGGSGTPHPSGHCFATLVRCDWPIGPLARLLETDLTTPWPSCLAATGFEIHLRTAIRLSCECGVRQLFMTFTPVATSH